MINFLIGFFVGGTVGVVLMALCVAAKNNDREDEENESTGY